MKTKKLTFELQNTTISEWLGIIEFAESELLNAHYRIVEYNYLELITLANKHNIDVDLENWSLGDIADELSEHRVIVHDGWDCDYDHCVLIFAQPEENESEWTCEL